MLQTPGPHKNLGLAGLQGARESPLCKCQEALGFDLSLASNYQFG